MATETLRESLLGIGAELLLRSGLSRMLLRAADRWTIHERGGLRFPPVRKRSRPCYQILLYHRVSDDGDPYFGGVPVELFRTQMEVLSGFFTVLPLETVVDSARRGDLPPNAVAITFDDGYRDNYSNAFPILKQFQLPATVFLATGPTDSRVPLWHDRVFHAFRRTRAESLTVNGKEFRLDTLEHKLLALRALLEHLRSSDPVRREAEIARVTREFGSEAELPTTDRMLGWPEIQEMQEGNITFGAHTVTHPILTRMSAREARDEIVRSKSSIEEKLGRPVVSFAYPNGTRADFDEPIKRALKDAGFECAVTTIWGTNHSETDPYELHRVQLWGSNPALSSLRLGWHKFIA